MVSDERPTKTLQRSRIGFTGQHAVVKIHQSLGVRVRVLTGDGELKSQRQIKWRQVHPCQVKQRFSFLQDLRGVAPIGRLLEGRLEPLEEHAVARPAGGAVGVANPTGPAVDQQRRQGEEQVEVLEAGVCQRGLLVLGHTVARDQAVAQQQLRGRQAELANLGSVLGAGAQSFFHQEHERGHHAFTVNGGSIDIGT